VLSGRRQAQNVGSGSHSHGSPGANPAIRAVISCLNHFFEKNP